VIANLEALGHTVDVDRKAVAEIARYFDALAEAEDLPVGAPLAYDAAYQRHQLPGGMVGTMRRHLGEQRLSHLEGAVIEEIGRVREELGWPIVMTPFAQMVLTQAVMNVTGTERYATIPDEVMRYALGKFGRPNVPIAAEVMDRIMASPRAKDLAAEEGMPDVATLRRRVGGTLSDEDFLLRATMPGDQVDAMREGAELRYDPETRGALRIVRRMLSRDDIAQVSIERPGFRLELA
jgi:oxaloacetate decarboxylase alpha subunit